MSLLTFGTGNIERSFVIVRYGSKLGNNLFDWELKYFDRDGYNVSYTGSVANGSWDVISGGLEINRKVTERDYFTLQGNTYDGD